jgi:hypothetical protein
MNDYFIEKYKNCEKINFHDFKIDHERNKRILNKLSEIIVDFNKLNETIIVTGGVALFLKYNKIYRSFKDIDLLINNEPKTKLKYLTYFNNKFLIRLNQEKFKSMKEYLSFYLKYNKQNKIQKFSESDFLVLSLISKDLQFQVDLIPFIIDVQMNNSYKSYDEFNGIKYEYVMPSKYIDYKYSFGRDVDKIDIEFYEKYLKNT